jgi:plasmid stabilization system protein ParE
MVTAKKVWWTEAAKKDLHNVYARVATRSIEKAKETIESILAKTASLESQYLQGLPVALLAKEPFPYKSVNAGFYKIIYSIVEETIVIETLYHERQDPVV